MCLYFLSEEEIKEQDADHAEANETFAEKLFTDAVLRMKIQGRN